MATNTSKTYHLYSYFRSTCTNRVVIAMHLKGIPVEHTYIDLGKAEHESPEFQALNPSKSVPILIIKEDRNETVLTQSIAILEYLEESLPTLTPLLPPSGDLVQRARVREMVNIITNDIQPITNGRIAKRVRAIRGEAKDQITFVMEVFLAGLTAYEELLAKYSGQFSVGDAVTMADVCFAPAVEMALAYGTNLDGLPRVMGLFKKLGELSAFQKGNWKMQGDTPEALRDS
ncbi:Glutathione S-transferase/chloride channel, C-terminal [Penicillium expansum]|uniref:Glutathione S-transferase/chloride channel, C-terminal n=1 Tax=Penicillium expansum TaxID=27334 RepID=A0A0A2KC69_PENEN|nr:Glutathione S-transferase/chloride channel, C-terminal [Penicillium expansum]KGO40845.1 Glutathione S-transferase/chloride channel, C-terminal [Penicillium expansum]KGO61720.1 Glutathione S-transferase/chloride channel, C-terminal [Penicillium expansum]KGO64471.1 Glutathione S-transferase/chloride channel, C-terminal [Penicillium expansum]